MRERLYKRIRQMAHSGRQRAPDAFLVVMAIVVVASGVGIAQSVNQTDDFEDQSVVGWSGYETYPQIASNDDPDVGDYSLYAETIESEEPESIIWDDGPTLDTNKEFDVTGTVKPVWVDSAPEIRIGITSPNVDEEGKNAFIMFDRSSDITYLHTYATGEIGLDDDRIEQDFHNVWVNFRLNSAGNGTVRAKVWEAGTEEPNNWQLERNFNGTQGKFGANVGTDADGVGSQRQIWIDSVTVGGTSATVNQSEELSIETRDLFIPGNTHPYTVYHMVESTDGTPNESVDVTESATITVENSSLLTVNDNGTMTAVDDENVSRTVNVTAEYDGENVTKTVVVARPTVENLEILPTGITRLWAIGTDNTIFALLIATFMGVAATRFAGAFAGLAVAEMVLVVGWLGGWVGLGIAMVSVFVAMFIGLNLAANIDYTVSR